MVAYLLAVALAVAAPVSYARDIAPDPETVTAFADCGAVSVSSSLLVPEDPDTFGTPNTVEITVIDHFKDNGLPDGQLELFVDEKLTEEEALSLFPEKLDAVLEDGTSAEVPVSWETEIEYEPENEHLYMYHPVVDNDRFLLSERSDDDLPYIYLITGEYAVSSEDDDDSEDPASGLWETFDKGEDSTGAESVLSPVGDSTSENENACFYYFVETMKLTPAAACGILSNIRAESNFNTGALGDSGTSYGICQWHNSRWTALNSYCEKNGYDPASLDGQLHYLQYELESSYYKRLVLDPIKGYENSAQGAYDSAYRFCVYFEVPANKESKGAYRGNYARDTYWPKYGGYVSSSEAQVTLKQVRKANLYLSDARALYDVQCAYPVSSVTSSYEGDSGFTVSSYDPESGFLVLSAENLSKDTLATFNKKVKLRFVYENEDIDPQEKTVTVGNYSKAALSLKAGNTKIYGDENSVTIRFYDKKSGNEYDISGDEFSFTLSKEGASAEKSGGGIKITPDPGLQKWSGKLNLYSTAWTKPVVIALNVKRAKIPDKVVTDKSSVTLNKAACGNTASVRVLPESFLSGLTVTGANERSKAALESGSININLDTEDGIIKLSLSENAESDLQTGTYSFRLGHEDMKKTSSLSVKVISKEAVVKYKAAGYIDLTKRSSSLVTFTPAVKNIPGASVKELSVDLIGKYDTKTKTADENDLRSAFRFVEAIDKGSFSLRTAYGDYDLHIGKYMVSLSGTLDDEAGTSFESKVLINVKQSLPAAKAEPSGITAPASTLQNGISFTVRGTGKKNQDLNVDTETIVISGLGADDDKFTYTDGKITAADGIVSGKSYRIKPAYRYEGQDSNTADRMLNLKILSK